METQGPKKNAQLGEGRAGGATDEDLKLLDGDPEAKLWLALGGWPVAPGWCFVMNK